MEWDTTWIIVIQFCVPFYDGNNIDIVQSGIWIYVILEMEKIKTRNTHILLIQTCVRLELDANYLISGLKKLFNNNIFFGGITRKTQKHHYLSHLKRYNVLKSFLDSLILKIFTKNLRKSFSFNVALLRNNVLRNEKAVTKKVNSNFKHNTNMLKSQLFSAEIFISFLHESSRIIARLQGRTCENILVAVYNHSR